MRTFKEYIAEKEEESTFIHYSHTPNLSVLSGSKNGSGIKGAEDERVRDSTDPRIKKRIYFYPSVGSEHLPRPEAGLGSHVYHAKLTNLHDASKPSQESNEIAKLAQKRIADGEHPHSAYESSVLDRGHDGYKTDNLAIVLNKDQPVKYMGLPGKPFKDHVIDTKEKTKSIFDGIPNKEGHHSSSMMTPPQTQFWLKNKSTLQKAAPSLSMEYGRLKIHHTELDSLKNELKNNHPEHPF